MVLVGCGVLWIGKVVGIITFIKCNLFEYFNSPEKKDEFTRMKVKLSVVVCCCVKIKEAMLASHDPVELVRLGVRFKICSIVWKSRHKSDSSELSLHYR